MSSKLTNENLTEQDAINRCVSGDMDGFATLYDMYARKIYRFIYYRTSHRQTAEDLTSVVFTKAFANFKSFDKNARFSTWLISIARNTVIDHYRTNKPTIDLEEAFDISNNVNLAREFELKEKLDQVKNYLNQLPAEQKDIVIMRLWDGLSYSEIADILGKKEASLRVIFSRTIAKMQKEIILTLLLLISLKV